MPFEKQMHLVETDIRQNYGIINRSGIVIDRLSYYYSIKDFQDGFYQSD